MLRSGDPVVPTFEGEPRLVKPPLLHWLQTVLFRTLGVHPWLARVPALLSTLGSLLLVAWVARRRFGNEGAAWAAAVFLTSPAGPGDGEDRDAGRPPGGARLRGAGARHGGAGRGGPLPRHRRGRPPGPRLPGQGARGRRPALARHAGGPHRVRPHRGTQDPRRELGAAGHGRRHPPLGARLRAARRRPRSDHHAAARGDESLRRRHGPRGSALVLRRGPGVRLPSLGGSAGARHGPRRRQPALPRGQDRALRGGGSPRRHRLPVPGEGQAPQLPPAAGAAGGAARDLGAGEGDRAPAREHAGVGAARRSRSPA